MNHYIDNHLVFKAYTLRTSVRAQILRSTLLLLDLAFGLKVPHSLSSGPQHLPNKPIIRSSCELLVGHGKVLFKLPHIDSVNIYFHWINCVSPSVVPSVQNYKSFATFCDDWFSSVSQFSHIVSSQHEYRLRQKSASIEQLVFKYLKTFSIG